MEPDPELAPVVVAGFGKEGEGRGDVPLP